MKTKDVSISAKITTRLILRLFLLDYENEVKHQNCNPDYHWGGNVELPDNFDYSTHEKIMEKIKTVTKVNEKGELRKNHDLVTAYQIIETIQITANLSSQGFINKEVREERDGETFTKKVFISGEIISKKEVEELYSWVMQQRDKPAEEREEKGVWVKKGVSFYTPDGIERAKEIDSTATTFIKIGEATFVPLNNNVEFRSHQTTEVVL